MPPMAAPAGLRPTILGAGKPALPFPCRGALAPSASDRRRDMTAPHSPLNTPEGEAQLLQDLLSAERAGAKVAGDSLQQTSDPVQRQLLEQVRQGEIESCKLLLDCLKHLGLEPNKETGAFYGKAMAIESLDERIPFIDKGQQWVIRKLREYLPGCQDPLLRSELERMLEIHEVNSAASH
jgi:hypothetical protein